MKNVIPFSKNLEKEKKKESAVEEGKPKLPKEEEDEEEAILRVGDIHHARCELHDAYIW